MVHDPSIKTFFWRDKKRRVSLTVNSSIASCVSYCSAFIAYIDFYFILIISNKQWNTGTL